MVGLLLVPVVLRGLGEPDYGVWLAAIAVAGAISAIDLGLGLSVMRQVATGSEEGERFVAAAGSLYLLLGVAGAIVITAAGAVTAPSPDLSPDATRTATWVFLLTGAGFADDQLLSYCFSVLAGLRRFTLSNRLATLFALVRAAELYLMLRGQAGVIQAVSWQTVTAWGGAIASLVVVWHV